MLNCLKNKSHHEPLLANRPLTGARDPFPFIIHSYNVINTHTAITNIIAITVAIDVVAATLDRRRRSRERRGGGGRSEKITRLGPPWSPES